MVDQSKEYYYSVGISVVVSTIAATATVSTVAVSGIFTVVANTSTTVHAGFVTHWVEFSSKFCSQSRLYFLFLLFSSSFLLSSIFPLQFNN